MQHTEWVESGRIHMGTTTLERRLDRIAAVQEKNSTGMTTLKGALDILKSVVESDAQAQGHFKQPEQLGCQSKGVL